jgi:di/tricarboxylate transporter
MIFIRRAPPARRFTFLRVALFFLAAGLWLGGVTTDNRAVTAVAIGVAFVALLVGLLARRSGAESRAGDDEVQDADRPRAEGEGEGRAGGS